MMPLWKLERNPTQNQNWGSKSSLCGLRLTVTYQSEQRAKVYTRSSSTLKRQNSWLCQNLQCPGKRIWKKQLSQNMQSTKSPLRRDWKGPLSAQLKKAGYFVSGFFITGEAKKMAIKTMSEGGFWLKGLTCGWFLLGHKSGLNQPQLGHLCRMSDAGFGPFWSVVWHSAFLYEIK